MYSSTAVNANVIPGRDTLKGPGVWYGCVVRDPTSTILESVTFPIFQSRSFFASISGVPIRIKAINIRRIY